MSLIFFPMSIGFMSHVDFKKRACRPVDFKGQGPQHCHSTGVLAACGQYAYLNIDLENVF